MQASELKTLRRSAGMSQAQLAGAIGMARETVGAMEREQAPIELRTELAVRYVTGIVLNNPRSLPVLYEHATELGRSLLNGEPMQGDDVDEVQQLISEWLPARGGIVGYNLLIALSHLVAFRKHGSIDQHLDNEVIAFNSAWNALAHFYQDDAV